MIWNIYLYILYLNINFNIHRSHLIYKACILVFPVAISKFSHHSINLCVIFISRQLPFTLIANAIPLILLFDTILLENYIRNYGIHGKWN